MLVRDFPQEMENILSHVALTKKAVKSYQFHILDPNLFSESIEKL